MSMPTQNTEQNLKCTACGADLPAGVRFCEQCGQAVLPKPSLSQPESIQSEYLLGHIPVKVKMTGKGFFGRTKYIDYELLITNQQLVFLVAESGDERWLQEQRTLDFDTLIIDEEFSQWRSLMEKYDFAQPLWSDYYNTPTEELLKINKKNFAVKINDLVSVSIELDSELDSLNLLCADGTQYHCEIYLLLGVITHNLLAQILRASQLKLVRNPF